MRFRPDMSEHEVTPQSVWESRRDFLQKSMVVSAVAGFTLSPMGAFAGLNATSNSAFRPEDKLTSRDKVTTYNNFYEFGTSKEDPAENAGSLKTRPWTVTVDGEVNQPKTFDIEQLLKLAPLEERIYRMRCVGGSDGDGRIYSI